MTEVLEVLKEIRDGLHGKNSPKILFAKDVANILKININEATAILKRDDINSIRIGRLKILEDEFYDWLRNKREKDNAH